MVRSQSASDAKAALTTSGNAIAHMEGAVPSDSREGFLGGRARVGTPLGSQGGQDMRPGGECALKINACLSCT